MRPKRARPRPRPNQHASAVWPAASDSASLTLRSKGIYMYAPAAPAAPAAPPQQDFTLRSCAACSDQLCNPCKHEISAYGACIWRERLRDCQSRSWCRSEIGAPWQPALAPGRSWAVCTALVQCRLQACCSDLCGLCALVGKEWTTVGPDSEIKLVGVSAAASTVIVSLCVCVSLQSGATGLRGALTRTPARFFSEIHIFQKVSYR